ncbi:hypothetical protein FDUTEX481_03442 [Tolypothrix sp. PCC 7601]|nr:hypothetical protein FDUTEX481_03442 [Tolypothrix sp. PCC 7601]
MIGDRIFFPGVNQYIAFDVLFIGSDIYHRQHSVKFTNYNL